MTISRSTAVVIEAKQAAVAKQAAASGVQCGCRFIVQSLKADNMATGRNGKTVTFSRALYSLPVCA